ncbi:MAG: DoxX family protein [Gemmatimonadota bacterium]
MVRSEWVATLSRVFCGIVFIAHGFPKIMNFEAASQAFAGMGFPGWMAVPVAIFEFFGGIVLTAGFLTRILAALFAIEMLVAGIMVHLPHGFDVYHFGEPMARGYEYVLALIVLLLAVILLGPGPLSIDRKIRGPRGGDEPVEELGA